MKVWLLLAVFTLSAQAAPVAPPQVQILCYHDVRDDVEGNPVQPLPRTGRFPQLTPEIAGRLDADQYAISTHNLAGHFDWLYAHGYHVISLQQLIDARSKQLPLPEKPVLLTFDDGLRSAYTRVFPLLKAYHYPAVIALVGAWVDLPADKKVDFGPRFFTRDDFLSWDQVREMQSSGLIEVASHSYDLHRGILANPQGNMIPAAIVPAYEPGTRQYETNAEYAERILADLRESSQEIAAHLGTTPRAIMWPYGGYTPAGDRIATSLGLTVSFTLGMPFTFPGPPYSSHSLHAIPRLVMRSNPSPEDLAWSLCHPYLKDHVRAVQVDLDTIYDPDPAQQERNLGALLERMQSLDVTQVWLQAFADPDGSNAAAAVYFPNRRLPLRADLFSRVAWQLHTRCNVDVYAWLPVLAWRLPDAAAQARLQISGSPGETPVRLNPFLPETRELVGDLYEDLARAAPIDGLLFGDDAILRDSDRLSSPAPSPTPVPGPGPARTQALIAFTQELQARAAQWRPQLKTARNLFAEPVLDPASEAWYAQSLPAFVSAYNEVALMAMPALENSRSPSPWLRRLVRQVTTVSNGLDRTVFELQTVDWRTGKPISTDQLTQQMRLLQNQGVLHLAYYPDDLAKEHPDLRVLSPVFSAAEFPAPRP
jgi:poly-beta-1,6-N-acetyl-D-glucosamine N-deacetylase